MCAAHGRTDMKTVAAFIRGVREHRSPFAPFYQHPRLMLAHHWGCYVGEQCMKYIVPILTGLVGVALIACEIAFRLGYLGA